MKNILLLTYLTIIFFTISHAQINNALANKPAGSDSINPESKKQIFSHAASYIGDFVNNLSGGKQRGSVYLGMANLKFSFNTSNLSLWDGGEFFINGAATHGGTPSGEFIGDFQVASNIEAGNHTYLHELWYRHSFENAELTIGLQDLNVQFVASEFGAAFINSSFGIPSLISDNVPVPIFPLTALGLSAKINLSENLAMQAAVFDGLPDDFENNPHNINWTLSKDNGAIFFYETAYSALFNELSGTYKLGGYYHTHFKSESEGDEFNEGHFYNYGIYLLADQTIYQPSDNNSLGLFIQLALSPANKNQHNYYIGGGFNYKGLFTGNSEDNFGLALAHAGFKTSEIKNETTIEVFYKKQITENLFIQPDFQYIINPAGGEGRLNNAFAGLIRFGINF